MRIESYIEHGWKKQGSLYEALGLNRKEPGSLSVVGAGGKTTVIARLMKEHEKRGIPVVVSTTTHIQQIKASYFLDKPSGQRMRQILKDKGKVWMGYPCGNGKIKAFTEQEQKKLLDEAIAMGACVLIEADGAKGRPCKAPADYEPVLHPDTVLVLSVYGLQAIGAAIEDSCLRVDKVEEILGKSGQDILTTHDIAILAASRKGGRKGVASSMDYQVILNQADDERLKEAAAGIGEELFRQGIRRVHRTTGLSEETGQLRVSGQTRLGGQEGTEE